MTEFLALIGGITIFIFMVFFTIGIFEIIGNSISELKYRYRIKHRFDKPPTAKCYCRDCRYRDEYRNNWCDQVKKCVGDASFCWEATPEGIILENKED